VDLLSDVAKRAVEDAGDGAALLQEVDTLVSVSSTIDEPEYGRLPVGRLPNQPKSIARALGIKPQRLFTTATGGNTPQMLVNHFAGEVADGRAEVVLATGGEVLASLMKRVLSGEDMDHWGDDEAPIDPSCILGNFEPGVNEVERAHSLHFMTNSYPLLENGWRHHLGHSPEAHLQHLGDFLSPMTAIASQNPYAWFPVERSSEEIATETKANRLVGYPYTKYMNSIMRVDQGAAWLMMSVGKARELGISEDKWVFIHGAADVTEIWNITERVDYHSSPAIKLLGQKAFAMAGWNIGDVNYLDIYSCFPSAIQLAAHELGVAVNDPRRMTVTGGLPYYGGAGNAYAMCSIAEMMNKLRAKPGSKGLVTANGWILTKHSMGLYSTEPWQGPWHRENPALYQVEIDKLEHPSLAASPSGAGTVETYTVVKVRGDKQLGVVIGRLDNNDRFLAFVPNDEALFQKMKAGDFVGARGQVQSGEKTNLFIPD
jgi:acetyl-CoA C-acetyltransferase